VKIQQNMEGMKEKMEGMAVDAGMALMVQMFEKLRFLENASQMSSACCQLRSECINGGHIGRNGSWGLGQ
jgi:hypothetical protein